MRLCLLMVAIDLHYLVMGAFVKIAPLQPPSFDSYIKTKQTREIRKNDGIRDMIMEGRLVSQYEYLKSSYRIANRFKRSSRSDSSIREIEEVKVSQATSDAVPVIYCTKHPSGVVSCRQNDFEFNIKINYKDMADETVVSLAKALYNKLASIRRRQKKRENVLMTIPPHLQKSPLVIVLPPTTTGDSCEGRETTEVAIESCYECTHSVESDRCKPIDSPFLIECCPADFEPRSIDQEESCLGDDPLKTSKRPTAFIYSCKWQGKRDVASHSRLIPMDPMLKISIDPKQIKQGSVPIKVVFEN